MEGFTCIQKLENLEPFVPGDKKLKEFVLTDADPYPGYYSETPGKSKIQAPQYVFTALKTAKGCYEDDILRAGFKIKERTNIQFESIYGRLNIYMKVMPCIRIKIDDLSHIPRIIEEFKKEGVEFETDQKYDGADTFIKLRKYEIFTKMDEGIYSGVDNDHYYIKVPKYIEWDDFVQLIFSIRNSGDFGVFDAALASLCLKNEILEFIRIYTKSFKKDDFKILKDEIDKRIRIANP